MLLAQALKLKLVSSLSVKKKASEKFLSARILKRYQHLSLYYDMLAMKFVFGFFLLFNTINTSAQLSFPKGFKRIKGERGSGLDDVYSNGRYSFQFHRESFFDDDYKTNDEKFKKYVVKTLDFHFMKRKIASCGERARLVMFTLCYSRLGGRCS
jgi:hypothetical protein